MGLLFSFTGRVSRDVYWQTTLAIVIATIGALYAARLYGNLSLILTILAAALYMSLAVGAKRLHDSNITGWWIVLFYVLPVIFFMAILAIQEDRTMLDGTSVALGFFGLLSLVIGLLLMGFRMGTRGPNQFGKDPLQERQARVEEKRRRKKMATRR